MKIYEIDYKHLKSKEITRQAALIRAENIKAALLEACEEVPENFTVCGITERI